MSAGPGMREFAGAAEGPNSDMRMSVCISRICKVRGTIRLAISLLVVSCLAGAARANERSEALVKAFQAFCTLPLQSFEVLDAKASAQKLPVQADYEPREQAHNNSERVRTKSWLVETGDGPYRLVAARRIAADGVQTDVLCGVAVSEMIGDDVKADLVKSLQLGSPLRQGRGGGFHAPGTISVWKMMFGSEEMGVVLVENNMGGTEILIGRHFEARQ